MTASVRHTMQLSVLDLVPVRTDQTTADALAATVRLAQTADRLGFTRYWLAEHHNMPSVAATNPPVLIAHLAAATRQIRVGSVGVMLPKHAPLPVSEQFALLEAAHSGDLPDRELVVHLEDCEECRGAIERIRRMVATWIAEQEKRGSQTA